MARYVCYDESIMRGYYSPSMESVLLAQPKPCRIWYDPSTMSTFLDTPDKPVNFILAGIVWHTTPTKDTDKGGI